MNRIGTFYNDLNSGHPKYWDNSESTIFRGRPKIIDGLPKLLAVCITLGLAYLYFWFQHRSIKYEITTRKLSLSRGFFRQRKTTIPFHDLTRAEYHCYLLPCIGYGRIVITLGVSQPEFPDGKITLYGIKELGQLDALLHHAIEEDKLRQRRFYGGGRF